MQTPIQTPLPGTADIYNIPTGPTDYPASGNENGGGGGGGGGATGPGTGGSASGNAELKSGRPSPYMVPKSPLFLVFCCIIVDGSLFIICFDE